MKQHNLKTLSQVLNILRERGISKEIRMTEDRKIVLGDSEKIYQPEDLCIVKSYRFEGNSSTDDNAVLYVLEDKDGEKSTVIDSYGYESNYTGPEFDNFIRKIPVQEKEEYNID